MYVFYYLMKLNQFIIWKRQFEVATACWITVPSNDINSFSYTYIYICTYYIQDEQSWRKWCPLWLASELFSNARQGKSFRKLAAPCAPAYTLRASLCEAAGCSTLSVPPKDASQRQQQPDVPCAPLPCQLRNTIECACTARTEGTKKCQREWTKRWNYCSENLCN